MLYAHPAVVAALREQGLKLADYAVKSAVNAAASGIGLTAVEVAGLAAPVTGTPARPVHELADR
jgi:hypothetical protein